MIEEWTEQHDHYQVMDILQRAGVAATPVLNGKEVLLDGHLASRGFFETIDHPEVGKRPHAGSPLRLSHARPRTRMPAPLLGQHNEQILGQLLGISEDEIRELERKTVVGSAPVEQFSSEQIRSSLCMPMERLREVGAVVKIEPDYMDQLGLK